MLNCHGLFRPEEVWFLLDTKIFKNRRMECGFCPHCNTWVVGLFERGKKTGILSYTRARDKKARKLYETLKSQIDYKKSDIPKGTKSNMGYVFGKNETVKLNGEKFIIQKAVDFNGTEKIVKLIKERKNNDK